MFGNIVPLTTVGGTQVLPGTVLQTGGNVLPTTNVGNNDLVIIQDTTTATSQAELINQLQNHITENQQILIITDDQGQDQCKFYLIKIYLKK
jgi:orotate phosphoribosyltransferase-like protein